MSVTRHGNQIAHLAGGPHAVTGKDSGNIRPLRRPSERHAAFERRWKTNWKAELGLAGARIPCTVIDLSVTGAGVSIGTDLDEGTSVSLLLQDRKPISARVVWHRVGAIGLCFPERQSWIIDLVVHSAKG